MGTGGKKRGSCEDPSSDGIWRRGHFGSLRPRRLDSISGGFGFSGGDAHHQLLGCLCLGVIGQFSLNHITVSPNLRIGLTIGLMGGFTTFSTFGLDTVRMLEEGQWTKASIYVGASVLGGLIAMMLGMRMGDAL